MYSVDLVVYSERLYGLLTCSASASVEEVYAQCRHECDRSENPVEALALESRT